MPQDPSNDGGDDLFAVMDFSAAGEPAGNSTDASVALDFSATDDGERPAGEAVDISPVYAPAAPEETATVLDAIDAVTHAPEEADDVVPLFTVTNPPGTVSVSALGDGAIDRVDLSADVTRLSESQLAEEILVIAHLAAQKGQAAQHELLFETMCELGAGDPEAVSDLLEKGMELASPQRAAQTQARMFATRYNNG
ncbi:DUF2694 domain-containing protein [Mycobacterium sp. 050272]|uniref:DUF2694 domain-containing protein n=1 Tax=Mycobacterium sp. 050272 TaxID=3142488 RepID=UPI00318F0D1A